MPEISTLLAALIIAIVQGITEWFPISSSGHIVLFERILGFQGGLQFSVALHFGTLMAVFVYFGREITEIVRHFFSGKWDTQYGRLGILLLVGSIPAAIIGFLIIDLFDSILTNLVVVSIGFFISGIFLLAASIDFNIKGTNPLKFSKAFTIGIAQALAIIPGISRSGATISSGVLLGLNEKNAMKFAFLLSIPVIFGANIITIGSQKLPNELIWATLVSFLVGLLSIHLIFRYFLTNRKNFRWFALYCFALAIVILIYYLFS